MSKKKLRLLFFIAMVATVLGGLLLFYGCQKEFINGEKYRVYTIKEGKHWAKGTMGLRIPSKLSIQETWMFGYDCYHEPVTPSGMNKITGVGDRWYIGLNHEPVNILKGAHYRSARFTWMPDWDRSGYIKLFAYVYGARKDMYDVRPAGWTVVDIGLSVEVMRDFDLSIIARSDYWEFIASQDGVYKGCIIYADIPDGGYKLFPFFGGRSVAPTTMKLYQKK